MFQMPCKRESNSAAASDTWQRFDGDFQQLFQLFNGDSSAARTDYSPSLDVKEEKDAYTVHIDLPGVDKSSIQVKVTEGILSVSGSRKAEHEEESAEKTWHRIERRSGSFERSLRLGNGVDANKVAAEYKDGVLKVTVPKKESSQAHVVEVQ